MRKLLWVCLFLCLLAGCGQQEPETAIWCDSRAEGERRVYELGSDGTKRCLSTWNERVSYREPYLFHVRRTSSGWRLISTTPEGTDERIWLDSAQLPAEYREAGAVRAYNLQLAGGRVFVPYQGDGLRLLVADGGGTADCFPTGAGALMECPQVREDSVYYFADQTLTILNLNTGERTQPDIPRVEGVAHIGLTQLDGGFLWYLDTDHAAQTCWLRGYELAKGEVTVSVRTDCYQRDNYVLQIHDGYLYCFLEVKREHTAALWEIPLKTLMEHPDGWESLFQPGTEAALLAEGFAFDRYFPPAETVFGARGLWLAYPEGEEAFGMDHQPGELRYIPYGH